METDLADLIKQDQNHLIHPLHHPVDHVEPRVWVKGRGALVQEASGGEFLDGLSGLWNVTVGHGRTELGETAAAQMRELAYYSSYVGSSNIPAIKLASRLIELAKGDMQGVFFTSGGAEANESAFKTARFYWRALGKPEKIKIIARREGYHGVTLQAMSATNMGSYWKMFEPRAPHFLHVQSCYSYRFEGAQAGESIGHAAARELEEMILREGPDSVAAFIGEPIHGAGGVIYPTDDYWPRVREICTRHNVLFIADEIITAFGRTGRWFGLEHWKVQPDIITFAKGVTSGYQPLGGMIVNKTIKTLMDSVKSEDRWMHGYTYSGHPTCCAVALRNIEIIEREQLCQRSESVGAQLHSNLLAAFADHPHAGDIRAGKGLIAAVEFVEDRSTKRNFAADRKISTKLNAELIKRGVVTRTRPASGAHPSTGDILFFAPPLVVTGSQVEHFVSASRDAAKAVFGI